MARRKKQDEDESQDNLNNSDDTFGLPEIEYEPLNREESPKTEAASASEPTSENQQTYTEMDREEVQQNEYNTYYNEDESNSPWPKILGIAALLLITAAAVWYFALYRPKEMKAAAEKARQEQEAAEARQRERDLAEQKRIEDERRRADSLAQIANKPVGTINTLTERTGRYYVIIASAVDGDLLMDYAQKLAPKGLNPKIIPPYGTVKFYRLAIDEGDTYASTQAKADQLKSEYTDGAWVIKY